jgi:glyoxylase I family protein
MPEGLVSHLIHTCIVCSDFERSLDFYTRVLGARVGGRASEGDAAPLSAAMGGPARRRWRGAMLYWGDPARTSYVDLISYDDGGDDDPPPPRRPIDPGYSRLCLRVTDVEAVAAHLRAAGVTLVSDPVDLTIEGRVHRILFFLDPDGTLLELSERA